MAATNEELMQSFVRVGRIMQHLDGGGRCCRRKHGHGGPGGFGGHGEPGAHGAPGEFSPEEESAGASPEFAADARMPEHEGHDPGCCGHRGGHGPRGPHGGHGPHGRGLGGRHGQVRALSLIAMQEGITQKDLAFLLGIRPQSAGEMLTKLEACGLIERRKSEADARAIQLYLTEDGRVHAQEIDRMRKVVAEDVFSVLTDDEKEQLAAILGKLQTELDKYRPHHYKAPELMEDALAQE